MHAYGKLYAFGKSAKTSFPPTPIGIGGKELFGNFLRKEFVNPFQNRAYIF